MLLSFDSSRHVSILRDDLVLVADRAQHARVGREPGLAAALADSSSFSNRIAAELLRRADRELLARQLPDLGARARSISSATRAAVSPSR